MSALTESLKRKAQQAAEESRRIRGFNTPDVRRLLHKLSKVIGNRQFGLSAYYGEIIINTEVRDLDGFVDLGLCRLLAGIDALVPATKTNDWPEYRNRDYKFEVQVDHVLVRVTVSAYLTNTPTNCRVVQTGVKVTETPIYAFECDEPIVA
jgi:hypothetical protein